MSLLAAVCLGLILIISSHVIQSQAFNILSLTVRGNIPKISSADGVRQDVGCLRRYDIFLSYTYHTAHAPYGVAR